MLTYRSINYEHDLEQIIPLIQNNLDSTYSLSTFKWKHLENPFGKSYGLLALDGEKIIGLRMFMFWEFNTEIGVKKAIRPVDTVTDKSYRGKGVFKKLTLDGLHNILDEYEIIFNTPNKNSLPGYIKMGWSKLEGLDDYKLGLINPFAKSYAYSSISVNQINFTAENANSKNKTRVSKEFLKWRYKDSSYNVAKFPLENIYVIYNKSKIKNIQVLIIYEIIGNFSKQYAVLNSLAMRNNTFFIYYYGGDLKYGQFLRSFKRNSPVVVIKSDKHLIGEKLDFSLGDLEGKL